MKRLLVIFITALCLVQAHASDTRIMVTQSAGKGSSHERIVALITEGLDQNRIRFEYTAGRNCVPAVQLWNDSRRDPVVMVYSSTSPQLSEQTGIPCAAQPDDSVKIYLLGMSSHYVCRHPDSKPITSAVKVSIAEAQKNVIDIARASGYDWRYVPGTSAQGLMMLANREVDWAFVNTTFGDEKIRAVPGISCDYIADPDSKTHKPLQSTIRFRESVTPFLNPVAVVMSKNLSPTQHQVMRRIFHAENAAFVSGVQAAYIIKDLPSDQQSARFYREFFEHYTKIGRQLRQ